MLEEVEIEPMMNFPCQKVPLIDEMFSN